MKIKSVQILLSSIIIFSVVACNSVSSQKEEVVKTVADSAKKEVPKEKPVVVEQVKIDTLLGFDVSHFQGTVDWSVIKESGKHFGIAKSTQGITYTDPEFHANWKALEENNLYRGTYHFYMPKDDPIKQAEHFVSTVKDMGVHHLPPALDLEGENIGGLSVEQYQKDVLKWLDYVEENLGMQPMIYTNHPFGNEYLNNDEFSKYKLWIAEYGREAKIPEAWSKESWTGWQYTQSDKTVRVKGNVDESKFLSSILLTSNK